MKRIENEQQSHNMPQMYAPFHEDEISLVDLWLVLVRRKKVLIYGLVIAFLLAALAIIYKKDQYEYISSIEIGRVPSGDDYKYVDSPGSAKAKLEQAYIPAVLGGLDEDIQGKFKVKIDVPKNTHLLSVITKGLSEDERHQKDFHRQLLGKLIDDLNVLVDSYKATQSSGMLLQEASLKAYENTQKLVIADIKVKIKQQEDELASLKKSKAKGPEILISNTIIRELYNQLRRVTDTAEVQILLKRTKIADVKLNIEKVIPAQYVVPFYQSVEKKGLSSKIIFVLIVFVGFIFAVIGAFIAEFAAKVREKMNQQEIV